MDVYFGKPGGGKGVAFAWHGITWLMANPDGAVVGNFAFILPPWLTKSFKPMIGLVAYLSKWYRTTFDVQKRWFPLTDEQCKEFYRWRVGEDWKLFEVDAEKNPRGIVQSFDIQACTRSRRILYLIDEAGQIFGSREWANTGAGVLFYAAQHRKLGDDTWLCSQSYKDIDVALMRKCQTFIHCVNRGKLKVWILRQPDVFEQRFYDHVPTGLPGDRPMNVETLKKDPQMLDLWQTFDTTAGVGMRSGGGLGDMGRKPKGVPWRFFIIGVCLFPVVSFLFLNWAMHRGLKAFTHSSVAQSVVKSSVPTNGYWSPGFGLPGFDIGRLGTASVLPGAVSAGVLNSNVPALDDDGKKIICDGWSMEPSNVFGVDHVRVMLSDGRVADSKFGEVQQIERWRVKVFGDWFEMRKKTPEFEPLPQNFEVPPNIWQYAPPALPGSPDGTGSGGVDVVEIGQRPAPVAPPRKMDVRANFQPGLSLPGHSSGAQPGNNAGALIEPGN
jgi:hypothetical protein